MMFANPEHVQTDSVGMFDLPDQLSQPISRIQRATVLVERRRKTVNTQNFWTAMHASDSHRDNGQWPHDHRFASVATVMGLAH